mmetsp:Transcript_71159/g.230310  ORF Transcript_71159/g.230310 Transcript_71159/m.230310 type:complete len:364 (-) Transcript_71159:954-2045(-)
MALPWRRAISLGHGTGAERDCQPLTPEVEPHVRHLVVSASADEEHHVLRVLPPLHMWLCLGLRGPGVCAGDSHGQCRQCVEVAPHSRGQRRARLCHGHCCSGHLCHQRLRAPRTHGQFRTRWPRQQHIPGRAPRPGLAPVQVVPQALGSRAEVVARLGPGEAVSRQEGGSFAGWWLLHLALDLRRRLRDAEGIALWGHVQPLVRRRCRRRRRRRGPCARAAGRSLLAGPALLLQRLKLLFAAPGLAQPAVVHGTSGLSNASRRAGVGHLRLRDHGQLQAEDLLLLVKLRGPVALSDLIGQREVEVVLLRHLDDDVVAGDLQVDVANPPDARQLHEQLQELGHCWRARRGLVARLHEVGQVEAA